MGKLFGTDGIRGIIGDGFDGLLAYKVGQAAAVVLTETVNHRPIIYVGKDTRASGDMLECAIASGICSAGADAVLTGVMPTPAIAYTVKSRRADAGIVISASHNPYEYNGIKIFSGEGFKLPDALEDKIETIIETGICAADTSRIGRIRYDGTAAGQYAEYVSAHAEGDFAGLRIAVDCANGAASVTAKKVFALAGLETGFFFDEPDGMNINSGCGSTRLGAISEIVTRDGYDAGFAFDGDADRFLAVDERGREVNGDKIMAICARAGNVGGVVATVLSNMGFTKYCSGHGIAVSRSAVGDRNVLEEMLRGGFRIGGEQSGHIIFLDHATTGDGQLTSIKLLNVLASGKKLSELSDEIIEFPQVMLNVHVPDSIKRTIAADPLVAGVVARCENKLGAAGRILVRPSGTEPLVRVMAEAENGDLVNKTVVEVAAAIERAAARSEFPD